MYELKCAERRYPWQPWKREPPQERPLTGTVTLNKFSGVTYLREYSPEKNTYKITRQGGRGGSRNRQWFPKKQQLIRYDQQANLQCKATLAKGHTRSPAIPRGPPRRSHTEVGEDQPRSQGFLLPAPTEQERERPWLGLFTWSQNKINSEGGVRCLSIILSGLFSPFTQWSKGQDRFAKPPTITEIREISA